MEMNHNGGQDATLAQIVAKITAAFEVDYIFLFGSRARGSAHEDSDYDVCVIAEMPEVEKGSRSLEISKLFLPRRFGLDVVVKTQAEYEESCLIPNHVCDEVRREGLQLYPCEIVSDPQIQGGNPTFRGTRITAENAWATAQYHEMNEQKTRKSYPGLPWNWMVILKKWVEAGKPGLAEYYEK